MDDGVTLAEHQRIKLAGMAAALPEIDAALSAYARAYGGRFIRYGSTATGLMRASSDVDIIADFPERSASIEACRVADAICFAHDLVPDSRPACWMSDRVIARALAEGLVLL